MVYDSQRQVIVMFGGYNSSSGKLDDTWEWNGTSWTLVSTTGPSPRHIHGMAYDSHRGVVVLFGGQDANNQALGDTWEWNGSTWALVSTSGPAPRWYVGAAMVYDSQRQVTVLFGGCDTDANIYNDTWEWDGTTWTDVSVPGPEPRYAHAMIFDSRRNVFVLHGGIGDNWPSCYSDTWEYDGSQWTLASLEGTPRVAHVMAYDSARDFTVLFGGRSDAYTFMNETWEIRFGDVFSPDLVLSVTPQPLVAGSIATFTVSQCDPYLYTYLVYSSNGKGVTEIPMMNTVLGLYLPKQALPPKPADSSGNVSWSTRVPAAMAGPIWIQAVQSAAYGKPSNVVSTSIE